MLFNKKKKVNNRNLYILDSSCILDRRLFFLLNESIIHGVFIVYDFVLDELNKIAKRDENKAHLIHESLESIKKMQKDLNLFIVNTRKENIRGLVDDRLVHFAIKTGANLVTNDFELCQKAKIYAINSVNINVIANNMKIAKLPGDGISIKIIKEGKEPGQGVGYLEDGTMVIVAGGIKYVGKKLDVVVSSVIQTPAGRILFGDIV